MMVRDALIAFIAATAEAQLRPPRPHREPASSTTGLLGLRRRCEHSEPGYVDRILRGAKAHVQ